ncbi:aspartyl-tRNA synthetase, putative [Ixodes scapularis]|uniref:Aspartyl-tRNA synthetase, putative n=1 Tax=Ixodes scapularis TaxID=6945 RepID=B7QH64_IXOSC|nr:aspartyl-tRNA synthetase, putative [Ixodes scapularis]|eukprot:XP_002414521.1 aspartyl-tRNA synthetase, putative [Ixodes scapularis]
MKIQMNVASVVRQICRNLHVSKIRHAESLKQILASSKPDEKIEVKGWVKALRKHKDVVFLDVSDGTVASKLQVVLPADNMRPRKNYAPDYVRSFLHLRPRLSQEAALLRVRSAALVAVHSAFQAEGFFHVHTPVITSNDCEGGGDVFSVKAAEESKGTKEDAAAREHFFGGPAFLTVSGQLHLEAAAMSLSRVYTVSPTFRAENCNTRRHLCEFCMVEAEEAFLDSLDALMDRTESLVKRSFNHILGSAEQDVDLVTREAPAGHVKTVAAALDEPFLRLTYNECIGYLKAADNRAFSHSVQWGDNLKTEHEEFIVKHCGNRPVFVTHFPASLKPFYMKRDSTGNLVEGFDLLVPYGGELCGGSLREDSYEVLKERMEALGMSENFSCVRKVCFVAYE